MTEARTPFDPPARTRPFWQWVLLAIAPGLLADAIGAVEVLIRTGRRTQTAGGFENVSIVVMLGLPIVCLIWLIVLAGHYYRGRPGDTAGARALFVIGCLIVNGFLYGGGCVMFISQAFHN
jgi:hypothetical protein